MTRQIIVSIVMPIRNEEKYIAQCIDSLLQQTYPKENMEFIFIDGDSTDCTKAIIGTYIEKYPNMIQLIDNPNKTVPYAMNIGIKAAQGKYIVRLDAHSEYARDYIAQCVYYLEHTDADNVGGFADTEGRGYIGESIALMLSSVFGVGNSNFRVNGQSGYVDTVPFGAFRREVFDKYGGYDTRLIRNQDNEMNYRIRKNGGKIYLANDIKLKYFCRNTIIDILKMALQNGKWNIITYNLCPGSMSTRHFIPFCCLLTFFFLIICWCLTGGGLVEQILFCLVGTYLVLNCIFSFNIGVKNNIKYIPILLVEFPLFHLFYGIGSCEGVFRYIFRKL